MPGKTVITQDPQGLHPCDLVMQGGITSGVVYPPVILQLKHSYRFHNIGGTSAGAMAAAAVAASEYGREKDDFQELTSVRKWLSQKGNMRNLFQPSVETKSLMNLVDIIFVPSTLPADAQQQKSWAASIRYAFMRGWNWLIRCIPLRWVGIWATRYPRPSLGTLFGVITAIVLAIVLSLIVFGGFSLLAQTAVTPAMPIFWYTLIISGLLCIWLGYQVGGLIDAIWKLSNDTNFFGICTGHNDKDKSALTDWISEELDKMACLAEKDRPLTFGHLKEKQLCRNSHGQYERCEQGQEQSEEGQDVVDASIALKMITTNLSQGQPYLMPEGLKGFLFKIADMNKLFPAYIVAHLTSHAGTYFITRMDEQGKNPVPVYFTPPDGYAFLPHPHDLPVVVTMRMSLSFPILLSAVPLYTIRASTLTRPETGIALEEADLQPNWFSDGGICNNFPLEFFDAWLPRYPTFGINLTSMPADAFQGNDPASNSADKHMQKGIEQQKSIKQANMSLLDQRRPQQASAQIPDVYLPKAQDVQDPAWQGFLHTWEFLAAIIGTGLGYRDVMQANLPSYRERVVQIRLNQDEGGLNLNMPPDTIEKIVRKGNEAGDKLVNDFKFEQHQWVRFLVLMKQLERNFARVQDVVAQDAPFVKLLDTLSADNPPTPPPELPYSRPPDWCTLAKSSVADLRTLAENWEKVAKQWEDALASKAAQDGTDAEQSTTPLFFHQNSPEPDPVLRITPEV